jgi:hypothetical protein
MRSDCRDIRCSEFVQSWWAVIGPPWRNPPEGYAFAGFRKIGITYKEQNAYEGAGLEEMRLRFGLFRKK